MAELRYDKANRFTDADGNDIDLKRPQPEYFSFGWSPTDTDVDQTAITNNTVNNIDNSQGFMSGLGKDGANTLVMGIIGLGFAAVVAMGIASRFKRKKK